jgi:signal transduction histidine kinase
LLCHYAYAQEILDIDGSKEVINPQKYMLMYEDKSRSLSIEQILTSSLQNRFEPMPARITNFGNTQSAVWLKLNINIQTEKKYYLQIENPYLDSVFFYYQNNEGNYQLKLTGKKLPIKNEDIASIHTIISLPTNTSKKTQPLYVRLVSNRYMFIDTRIIDQHNILSILLQRYLIELVFLGVILLAIIYNLFMFFSVKDFAFLFYVIYTFFIGINLLNTRGYLSLFFPEYRDLIGRYTYLISSIYPIFVMLFSITFLKFKTYSRILYRIAWGLLSISILRIVLNMLGLGSVFFKSSLFFLTLDFIFYVVSGIIIYTKGYKPAIYYLTGWGSFIILTNWATMSYTGVLEFHSFSKYLTPAGIVLETIISSLALANRINILQRENVALIERQKENLEKEVEKRTSELEETKQEIETQNEELQGQRRELIEINRHLETQNKLIENQYRELHQQKNEILELNNNLESKVHQRTVELQHTLDNLTKQHQDLAQFSYIVSHNLRSPVARLLGLISLFNEQNYDDQANRQIFEHLKKTSHDLDTVIKDLTQIITIRNDLNKTKESVNLMQVIETEKFLLKDEIEKAQAEIHTFIGETDTIYCIKSYVQSILHNLLSNAIKYRSDKRKLSIYIRIEKMTDFICLSVEDNGLGIDLSNTDTYKIFGLYQRMHEHVEGKGLGLFLVKTQVESFGGKIEIESKLDVGTTFKVYFPV